MFRNDLQANTWQDIMSGIEEAATINNVIEGRGRAEGYALGLFEAGAISDSQRKELASHAFKRTIERANWLHSFDQPWRP